MTLQVKRLGGTNRDSITSEVTVALPSASIVLWHLAGLPGVEIIAKKSWAMTDDFEAYFLYKGRLFVLDTPFVNIWLSLQGQPADEQLFAEVENRLKSFNKWLSLFFPLAFLRYLFTPFNPPKSLLEQHGSRAS